MQTAHLRVSHRLTHVADEDLAALDVGRPVVGEFLEFAADDLVQHSGRIDPKNPLQFRHGVRPGLYRLGVGAVDGHLHELGCRGELRMHLAWRWFTGLGFDQEIPHHSTFSKNRHGRFQESNLFQELFERIVDQCIRAGLVKGDHMSVDGSFVQADATGDSRIPREQLAEAAQVNRTVRQYLSELEQENGDGEPVGPRWLRSPGRL
jgi:hypothetical protein